MMTIHRHLSAFAFMFLLLAGCMQQPAEDAQEIETATRMIFDRGWSAGDYSAFDMYLADTVVFHYSTSRMVLPRDQMSGFVRSWRAAFPDLRFEIEELLTEGEIAAVRLTLSGTHEGPWMGAEPTGEPVRMPSMMFLRFENGKMVEVWECDDKPGLQEQLGITDMPTGPGEGAAGL